VKVRNFEEFLVHVDASGRMHQSAALLPTELNGRALERGITRLSGSIDASDRGCRARRRRLGSSPER
jgi:hypothetical protein